MQSNTNGGSEEKNRAGSIYMTSMYDMVTIILLARNPFIDRWLAPHVIALVIPRAPPWCKKTKDKSSSCRNTTKQMGDDNRGKSSCKKPNKKRKRGDIFWY